MVYNHLLQSSLVVSNTKDCFCKAANIWVAIEQKVHIIFTLRLLSTMIIWIIVYRMPLKMSQLEGTAYIDTEWNDEIGTTNQVPNSCQISKSQLLNAMLMIWIIPILILVCLTWFGFILQQHHILIFQLLNIGMQNCKSISYPKWICRHTSFMSNSPRYVNYFYDEKFYLLL